MFRWLAMGCLLLCAWGWPGGATASADSTSFMQALRATRVGPSATDAMSLIALLKTMGKPEPADALQRELLHLYLASLNGVPPDLTLTIGQTIDRGAARVGDPDASAWQPLYDSLSVEWQGVTTQLPPGLQSLTGLPAGSEWVRAGPGLWATGGPRLRIFVSMRLRNSSLQAVPLFEPSLQLPGETALPPLPCRVDSLAEPRQRTERRVIPSGITKDMICETEGDASVLETLAERMAEARLGKIKPVLRATEAETAAGRARLTAWLLDGRAVPLSWSRAWEQALLDPKKKWMAGGLSMAEPRPRPTLRQAWAKRSDGIVAALAITMATVGLFGVGRLLRHMGWPPLALAGAGAVVVLAVATGSFISIAGPDPTHGDGWNRPIVPALAVVFYLAFIVPGLVVLAALHRVLDREGISWMETVGSGWRQAIQWSGTATRGEFWGFAVHATWLWALARFCVPPLDWLLLAVLLPPMAALTMRRWRTLTTPEIMGLCLMLVLVVLELIPEH
jgi:hypothetical protein